MAEAEILAVTKRPTSIADVKFPGKCFLSAQNLCSRGDQCCISCWQLTLVMCKSPSCGTGSEGTKGSWRPAESWQYESLGEAMGEGEIAVEASRVEWVMERS